MTIQQSAFNDLPEYEPSKDNPEFPGPLQPTPGLPELGDPILPPPLNDPPMSPPPPAGPPTPSSPPPSIASRLTDRWRIDQMFPDIDDCVSWHKTCIC